MNHLRDCPALLRSFPRQDCTCEQVISKLDCFSKTRAALQNNALAKKSETEYFLTMEKIMSEKFVSSLSVDVSKEPVDLLLAGKNWSISIDRKNGVEVKGEVDADELRIAAARVGLSVLQVLTIKAMVVELKMR